MTVPETIHSGAIVPGSFGRARNPRFVTKNAPVHRKRELIGESPNSTVKVLPLVRQKKKTNEFFG
jgi:hypothetical protein